MNRVMLGGSTVEVSEICLGTMTFGNQTDEAVAHAQMDRALDAGVTFFDCAEMYPVNPVRRETIGRSEEIIGSWLAARGSRPKMQIATKITGPSDKVRDNRPVDAAAIHDAIDASLKRLGTDYIDLYQMHWPNRGSYGFRQNWTYDPSGQDRAATIAHMHDVLGALSDAVTAGKIRSVGLSNDSAWGMIRWIDTATEMGAPRMVSMQNEYSLLYRHYDTDLAEMAVNEDVTLLSYSPLAAGLLTGKYADGTTPAQSRAAVDKETGGQGNLGGRRTERALAATAAYHDLAAKHGIDPVHMAIAWQLTRPFKVVPIIGATTDVQLAHLIDGFGLTLSDEVLRAINRLHREHPMPY